MRDEVKYAVLVGRLIDLFSRGGDHSSDDHRTALRALVELAARGSATLRLEGGSVRVEGIVVPDDSPFLETLKAKFLAHRIATIQFANGASAIDLANTVRALVTEADGENPAAAVQDRLREYKVATVSVVAVDLQASFVNRRDIRVTEALRGVDLDKPLEQQIEGYEEGLLSRKRRAYDEMVGQQPSSAERIAGVEETEELSGVALRNHLDRVIYTVTQALNAKEYDRAVEALVRLIRSETSSRDPDTRRAYGVALRRLLATDSLRWVAPYLLDEMFASDVIEIMRRAGTAGTKVLLDMLIAAPTVAERKAYLRALRGIEEGTEVITSLLNHHEWFVVRNAADLVGELKIEEAVPALGKVMDHDDARARKSVGIALARIATPAAALHLRKAFRDPDPDVRLVVAREVGGKGMSGLAMPIVSAASREENEEILCEYYRALGRIGTPDSVQALTNAALEGSRGLLGRKASPAQLAAVEGLATAGGRAARDALEQLAKKGGGQVKSAARQTLAMVRPPTEE